MAPTLLAFAVVGAAVYALLLREPVHGLLAPRDAYALRTFANFYLTVPGLLAALLGFALLARRVFWRAPELFTTVALFSFFFFYKIRIVSDHFWMARRFLPVILPGALLFAAAAALSGTRGGWAPTRVVRGRRSAWRSSCCSRRSTRARQSRSCRTSSTPESSRSSRRCRTSVGDRDLLVVESRNASDTHVLALPLAYIYARNVLVLNSPKPDKTRVRGIPRLGAHALRPRAVHGRRRHRPAVAGVGRARRSRANGSRSPSTTRRPTPIRDSSAARSSTTACTS